MIINCLYDLYNFSKMKVIAISLYPYFFFFCERPFLTHSLSSKEEIRIHWDFRQPNHQGAWVCKYVNNVICINLDVILNINDFINTFPCHFEKWMR